MQCIVIRQVAFEDLGVFAPVLRERGYTIDYREGGIDQLEASEWTSAALLVILGGPIGVYEQARYPWLAALQRGIATRLAHGAPTLGICLGAQLMAAALGARVYPGAGKEIGWAPLQLAEGGQRGALGHLDGIPVLHWHGDTFDLPAGAALLASTPLTPHQAFAVGHNALALQFHPEVEPGQIERWLIGHAAELAAAGIEPATLRVQAQAQGAATARAGRAMLDAWLEALAPPAR